MGGISPRLSRAGEVLERKKSLSQALHLTRGRETPGLFSLLSPPHSPPGSPQTSWMSLQSSCRTWCPPLALLGREIGRGYQVILTTLSLHQMTEKWWRMTHQMMMAQC